MSSWSCPGLLLTNHPEELGKEISPWHIGQAAHWPPLVRRSPGRRGGWAEWHPGPQVRALWEAGADTYLHPVIAGWSPAHELSILRR